VTLQAEPVASLSDPSSSDAPRPASLTVRTATGAGWIITWRMTTRVLGLANTLFLVHLLLPADFGLVALATSMSNAVDLFSTIGVEQALIREKHLDRAVYDTGFTINLLRALAVGLVVAAGAEPAAAFYGDPRLMWILLALSLGLLLSGLENIRVVDFQRDLAFGKRFQILLLPRIAAVLASIGFALIYRNYWALVVGILTNRGMQLVLTYVILPWLPRMTLRSWRQILGFSFWLWATATVQTVRDRIDALVIGRVLGPTSVGIYGIGVEIGSLTSTELVQPLTTVLFSGFSAARRTGGASATEGYFRAISATFLLTLPLGFGLSLLAAPIVRLMLGEHWVGAVPMVQIFAVLGMARVIAYFSGVLLNSHAMLTVQFRIMLFSLLVRLGVLAVLIRPYGLLGAATAAVACTAAEEILFLIVTFRRFQLSPVDLLASTWRCMLASAAMAAVLVWEGIGWAPATASTTDALRALALGASSGAATYTVTLLLAWWCSGSPRGAETFVIDVLQQMTRHFGRRWGFVR
jgi:lipopolysaccharide exporter